MTAVIETISPEALAALRVEKETALSVYSKRYAEREERHLAGEAQRRAAVLRQARHTRREIAASTKRTLDEAIIDPQHFDVAELANLGFRLQILEKAARYHVASSQADAEKAVLVAKIAELAAQSELQSLIHQVHDTEVALALSAAAELNGDNLDVMDFGGKSTALGNVVSQINSELARAREALRQHTRDTQAARDAYEKGENTWPN